MQPYKSIRPNFMRHDQNPISNSRRFIEILYDPFREREEEPFILYSLNNFVLPPHFHFSYELLFIQTGEMRVQINSQKHIMRGGDVALIMPGEIHGYESIGDSTIIALLFLENYFPEIQAIFSDHALGHNIIHYPNSNIIDFVNKCDTLNDKNRIAICFKGYVNTLILTMLESVNLIPCPSNVMENSMKKALSYIHQEYDNGINLDQTARELGISPAHLSRSFKKIVGTNFNEYVNQIRIERAKRLLREGRMTVFQIAIECGFGNHRSFNRAFKKYMNITPSEYITQFE